MEEWELNITQDNISLTPQANLIGFCRGTVQFLLCFLHLILYWALFKKKKEKKKCNKNISQNSALCWMIHDSAGRCGITEHICDTDTLSHIDSLGSSSQLCRVQL